MISSRELLDNPKPVQMLKESTKARSRLWEMRDRSVVVTLSHSSVTYVDTCLRSKSVHAICRTTTPLFSHRFLHDSSLISTQRTVSSFPEQSSI